MGIFKPTSLRYTLSFNAMVQCNGNNLQWKLYDIIHEITTVILPVEVTDSYEVVTKYVYVKILFMKQFIEIYNCTIFHKLPK